MIITLTSAYCSATCMPWFCLTPFGVYGQLQQLFLVSPHAPLPGLSFMARLLSMSSPTDLPQSGRLTLGILKQWSISLLQSPWTLVFVYSHANAFVDSLLPKIVRYLLPRLGVPDIYSVVAAKLDGMNGALLETLEYDAPNRPWRIRVAEFFHGRWQRLVGKHPVDQSISDEDNQATMETLQQNNSEPQPASQSQIEPTDGQPETTTAGDPTTHPADGGRNTGAPTTSNPEDIGTPSNNSPVEPPPEGFWVAHDRGPTPATSVVRVHHRTRRTQPRTPHDPNPLESPMQQQPLQSRSPAEGPKYRVTCLSTYPLNALTSHLSSHLATLITLPLETYMIRRLVGSFLATGGSPWIPARADPLALPFSSLQPGIGTRTLLRSFTYPRRLLVRLLQCTAMELMVTCVLVIVGSRGAMWYGTRYHGWRRETESGNQ